MVEMKFLAGLENNLEKLIEGFFHERLKGGVGPAYIAKCLLRHMRDNRRGGVNKVYVPGSYEVYLAGQDYQALEPVMGQLAAELAEYLNHKARDKDYHPVGQVTVDFAADPELVPGRLRLVSNYSSDPEDAAAEPGAGAQQGSEHTMHFRTGPEAVPVKKEPVILRAYLVVEEGAYRGRKLPLEQCRHVLGRRASCDIVLAETTVSRRHACLEYLDGSYYLTDLGSANGTFVNGNQIQRKKLAPGDELVLGNSRFIFEVG